ncbi:LicD family protein [Anaerocolumna jejuensis]|uniref:LicD family protein n=1 Tax=Anaerocolumna jejuensis TaxID=259063 RepID=UPI003F7C9640
MAILNTDIEQQPNQPSKLSDDDKKIIKYINGNTSEEYIEIIRQDSSWPVFFQLSEMRWGLYSWYDFGENSNLLEVGAGYGALTGLFCSKCRKVTATEKSPARAEALVKRFESISNLEVCIGDAATMDFQKKFDFIILTGILERQGGGSSDKKVYAEYLQKLKKLLTPAGKILIAVENRFGLKYICGAIEPHTGKPFDGLNHYPFGTGGYSFTKEEMIAILKLAGLESYKFYYPLPDYKIPQIIYSQNYLPQTRVGERLVPYYVNKDSLIAVENDMYDDVVENGVFEFFANSFLIECSMGATACSVDYAAVTVDRGHEQGTVTAIHNTKRVTKQAVFTEGIKNIIGLCQNIWDLQRRGIPAIEVTMEKDTAVMPMITEQLASVYLKQAVLDRKIDLYVFFEQLHRHILMSSEHVLAKDNALLFDEKAVDSSEYGVILSKAYIEMIPMNAFWINDDFLFFDQEFVYQNYPAGYVLFRAIKNTYIFIPEAERLAPLNEIKNHFKLDQVWDIYEKQDMKFLKRVRKMEENKAFYAWTDINRERIYKKSALLTHKDEIIEDYKVSDKMKKIWEVQLRLVEKIEKVCDEKHLKFYIIRGTLLGAVRHKGFIPWDDDIDIALPREDYEKLIHLPQHVFGEDYFLQTAENDTDCFYGIYARLRDNNSTAFEMKDWGRRCQQGIWIDIFPLDSYDQDERFRKRQNKKIDRLYELLTAKTYRKEMYRFGELNIAKWKWYKFITVFVRRQTLINMLNTCCLKCKNPSREFIGIFTHYKERKIFYKEDFSDVVLLEFEHRKLPAPIGYKRCLEMSVAKDYMLYPPVEKRVPHHHGIFIPELPYAVFNNRYMHSFQDIQDKTIILFGAGLMVEDYLKKFGKKYPPAFLVDNNSDKWGTRKCGIEVRNPQEILNVHADRRKLFICNVYYKQIEKQLKNMGVTDYCIYVQDRNWILEDENKE